MRKDSTGLGWAASDVRKAKLRRHCRPVDVMQAVGKEESQKRGEMAARLQGETKAKNKRDCYKPKSMKRACNMLCLVVSYFVLILLYFKNRLYYIP